MATWPVIRWALPHVSPSAHLWQESLGMERTLSSRICPDPMLRAPSFSHLSVLPSYKALNLAEMMQPNLWPFRMLFSRLAGFED